jgi:Uncharacterized membrane protein, putative virulence factor
LTEKREILKSASIISLVTVVSRVLGYVRDQRITLLLGTTLSADSFVLAYRIPNLFRRLVGEGTVAASFIPVFTTYMRDRSSEELWAFANRLFWTIALVLAVIIVLGNDFLPGGHSDVHVYRRQCHQLGRSYYSEPHHLPVSVLSWAYRARHGDPQ